MMQPWWTRLRRGDPRAFEDLVIAYQHRVFGVALRMLGNRAEAEELAQEVFIRVHRAIGDFRGEAKLSTWLYAIASRLCLNRLSSGERRMARQGEETLDPPGLERGQARRRRSSGASWRPRFTARSPSFSEERRHRRRAPRSRRPLLRGDRRRARARARHGEVEASSGANGSAREARTVPAMTCHDAREQFSALVDDALSADERATLDAHLATCADCRRELQRFRDTVGLLRRARARPRPGRLRRSRARGFAARSLAPAPRPRPVPSLAGEAPDGGCRDRNGRRRGWAGVPRTPEIQEATRLEPAAPVHTSAPASPAPQTTGAARETDARIEYFVRRGLDEARDQAAGNAPEPLKRDESTSAIDKKTTEAPPLAKSQPAEARSRDTELPPMQDRQARQEVGGKLEARPPDAERERAPARESARSQPAPRGARGSAGAAVGAVRYHIIARATRRLRSAGRGRPRAGASRCGRACRTPGRRGEPSLRRLRRPDGRAHGSARGLRRVRPRARPSRSVAAERRAVALPPRSASSCESPS